MSRSKTFRICGETKPIDAFYTMKGMRDGYRNECKVCNLAAKCRRYQSDPDRYVAMVARWQKANSERVKETRRRNNARPERKRKQRDA